MRSRLPVFLWHLGRRGGGPRYTLELAQELRKRDDVAVHLALSRQSELFDETVALGLPTLPIDTYDSVASFVTGSTRIPAVAATIRRYVEQHRLPVALCTMAHLWNALLVPWLKKAGAGNCLVVHDAVPHTGENYAVRHLMIKHDVRQADALITLSEAVRRQVIEAYRYPADRIWTSSMGPFRYGRTGLAAPRHLAAAPHRLLFFGRLRPYKGLDNLIEAMRLLERRHFPVTLSVVGEGTAELPGLPANVRIERRWVPESEIGQLFTDVDLVVLPYREASQSGVIPIAHHFGVPTVVTPLGGLPEQLGFGEKGFIAEGFSPEALADCIVDALSAPQRYAEISAAILRSDGDAQWTQAATEIVGALRALATTLAMPKEISPPPKRAKLWPRNWGVPGESGERIMR